MGYTPVFSSVFDGTLHGKWPQTGVWLALLAMSDRHGCIDRTPQAIASDIGISVGELIVCLDEFMQPDPMSRTQECEGRRLVLIDEARPWGWRLVNHSKYREKARKATFDAERTADGRNAERMASRRETREDPRRPDVTRADPPSDSRLQTPDSEKKEEKTPPAIAGSPKRAERAHTATRLPSDFELTAERQATARAEAVNPEREFARFCDHWRAASGASARKHDWDAAWRNWCRKAKDIQPSRPARPAYTPSPTTEELEAREAARGGK